MSESKKRLGKGLDALFSSTRIQQLDQITTQLTPISMARDKENAGSSVIQSLPLEKIQRNPHQPRQSWDDRRLFELAESIKANGLIQPIIVRPMGDFYQMIAGERRFRAMRLAGKNTIPAIIREANEEQLLEWALIENIHRDDLNTIERARAYHNYLERFSFTQQQAAQRLGEDRSTIANYIRILELSDDIQDMIAAGQLSMGHARAILGLSDLRQRRQMADMIVKDNLSVRQTEKQVQAMQRGHKPGQEVNKKLKNPHILELESQMSRALGTKVTIHSTGRKNQRGKIIIEFYSLDDFDRIKELLQC